MPINPTMTLSRRLPLIILLFVLTASVGCSIDGSINGVIAAPSLVVEGASRTSPDFVPAEIVTTGTGHRIRAVIGDPTEKVNTSSGYSVEAVFYE